MIRQIQGSFGKLLVLPVALSIGLGNSSSLLAAARPEPAPPTAVGAMPDLASVKSLLTMRSRSPNPRAADKAKHALRWLEIATAETPAERSAKIRQLGVSVVRAPGQQNGRTGIVSSYIVAGKVRSQRFTPVVPIASASSAHLMPESENSSSSGPSTPTRTGRWKDQGDDGCNWDPNDTGADQCGPPVDICDNYGQPAECSTTGEMEDADMVSAQAEYEGETAQGEAIELDAQVALYCYNNSSMCGGDEEQESLRPRGPSIPECHAWPCWQEARDATERAGDTIIAVAGYEALKANVGTLGKLAKVLRKPIVAGLVWASFWTGYYIGSYIDCVLFLPTLALESSVHMSQLRAIRPVSYHSGSALMRLAIP